MKITGIHREDGRPLYFKLDNDRIITVEKCKSLVKNGEIENLTISKSRRGLEFVKQKRRNQKMSEIATF